MAGHHRCRAEEDGAGQESSGSVAARLFGIANILDGMDRDSAARQAGQRPFTAVLLELTRQTLRDWVIRYNAQGIEGLRGRAKGHARRALTPEQEQRLEELVPRGPEGPLVRWRRVDLRDVIGREFGVEYRER